MYAVIETGGKQYRVQEGDVITIEKLNAEVGETVTFDKVLVLGEGKDVKVGTPYVDAAVTGSVVENGKGQKVIIFKYKAKKDYRKKQGHRQPYTMVKIESLGGVAPKKAAAKKAPAKKVEVKETFAVQFAGKDYASDVIVKLVKDAYKATKNKAAIKTLNVYVNTDDSRAYYVINDEFHGSVEL